MKSNPNPSFYPVLLYKSIFSHAFINEKIKENKIKGKSIFKTKRKEKEKKY